MTDTPYSLLAPGIQRKLYDMEWSELRPLQKCAIEAVLKGTGHVLLAASTAAGKTEAAFLPIVSQLSENPPEGSVGALAIGPLRALLDDQFRRLEDLCTRIEVPVHRWHGDVAAQKKHVVLERPGGVLLITPESLESLLVNHPGRARAVLARLRFAVIDELHAFLGTERGRQLLSLLHRVRRLGAGDLRLVGLSATLGDLGKARDFLALSPGDGVTVFEEKTGERELLFRLHAYEKGDDDVREKRLPQALLGDLVDHCRNGRSLVFASSRAQVETAAAACSGIAEKAGLPVRFHAHHGSLAREIRGEVEEALRARSDLAVLCSSTLELGIDVGKVRLVGQIGAPPSVASLVQRTGRSGRRKGEPARLRIYVAESAASTEDAAPLDRLHLELVEAIAASTLLLEGWIEPPTTATCDLSTLTQQIVGLVAQEGGGKPDVLHRELCAEGAFPDIEVSLFASLLRCLGKAEILEQMGSGDLILGREGERLRTSLDFYGAFSSTRELAVRHGPRLIGFLPVAVSPAPGETFLLAGKSWRVAALDEEGAALLVVPAPGGAAPVFLGGGAEMHGRVARRMRELLEGEATFSFVDDTGARLLEEARDACRSFPLPLVPLGDERTAWLPFTGSRAMETLRAMLAASGWMATGRRAALILPLPEGRARKAIDDAAEHLGDPARLAAHVRPRRRRKHDPLLDDELLVISIERDGLDLEGAREALEIRQ